MAILIPDNRTQDEFNGSNGEWELYQKLRELPDIFMIFHSAEWTKKKKIGVQFGEADFAIYHSEYGIICLEVKSGGIYSKDGRIYQTNRRTNQSHEISPMRQAEKSAFHFYDLLSNELRIVNKSINVYSAVWFTDVKEVDIQGSFPLKYHPGNNTFFREQMFDVEKNLISCFKYYGVEKHEKNAKLTKVVQKILSPSFQVFPSMSSLFELNEVQFNQMTREQSYLLDYLEEQKFAAIQGGAGTGKTMLALEKARRLSEEGRKVLFLGYNKLLMDSLQTKYGYEMSDVTFTNLDSLLTKARGARFIELQGEEREQEKLSYLENFDSEKTWIFEDIILDEGQDFSDEQISKLKEIALLQEGSFYVFYDKNQLIQQRTTLGWLENMECRLVLTFNCRNTLEIAETSAASIGLENVKVKRSVESSVKPNYHNVDNSDELLDYLESRIGSYLEQGVRTEDMVIITTKTLEKSWINNIKKICNVRVTNEIGTSNLLFSTSRKFKGLEASIVFLIDVDSETFSSQDNRMLFYVGASRAKNSLEIISCVEENELSKFYVCISGDEKRKRKTAVKEALKVKVI